MQFKKTPIKNRSLPSKKIRLKYVAANVLASVLLACSTAAWANEADEVSELIKRNQYDQALARAEAFLANRPNDAQMRFLKGLILTERNKPREAITVFTKLTEDFPELPEPYNNLAVLYAGQGEYEKARESLEMAIRTHPSYATAYENLGDVYAKLASQSYDKALQLDGRNSTAQTKLAMVRNIVSDQGTPVAAAPVAAAPVASAPVQATASTSAQVAISAPTVAVPSAPAVAAVAPVPAITTRNATPAATPPEPQVPATQTIGADRAVLDAVEGWAKAWSDQDMGSYLDSYSQTFEPPRGMSRKDWERQRERRIVGKDRIRVVVDNPLITLTGNTAVVKFKQSYFSNRLNNVANKTLTLRLEGDRWRIVEEKVGS